MKDYKYKYKYFEKGEVKLDIITIKSEKELEKKDVISMIIEQNPQLLKGNILHVSKIE